MLCVYCVCGVIITELLVQFEKEDASTSTTDVKREMGTCHQNAIVKILTQTASFADVNTTGGAPNVSRFFGIIQNMTTRH